MFEAITEPFNIITLFIISSILLTIAIKNIFRFDIFDMESAKWWILLVCGAIIFPFGLSGLILNFIT